ncbi:MAG: hypothetical protein J6T10_00940 [Methanobrevibacter sp.]|nr:hypothetical protein [Methanobrevibacter sp.]
MNVNLYYIHGISRIDTPYFATKTSQATLSKQEEFFSNHLVQSVELSFYPPHYRNTIRFDIEDITFNTNVNYLSLEYNDKTYYYFIDSINYISESIIELEVTMDTIQTYMFDIYISNGIIERKFINRWIYSSGNYIFNRNYIRENVSNNEFVFNSNEVLNSDTRKWFVFTPCTKYLNISERTLTVTYDKSLPGLPFGGKYVSSYPFFIFPYYDCRYTGKTYGESNSGEIAYEEDTVNGTMGINDALSKFTSMNTIVDMYVCPFQPATNLYIDGYNYLIANSSYYKIMRYAVQHGSASWIKLAIAPYTSNDLYGMVNNFESMVQSWSRNVKQYSRVTNTNTNYSSSYMPVMYDENYIRIQYGSLGAYTSIPLYKVTSNLLKLYAAFNPTDGTRLYWLNDGTPDEAGDNVDKYNTVVMDTNVIHYDLKNDPWVNYVSANRSRWVAAGVNTAITIFTKGASNALRNSYAKQDMKDILSNPKSYDKRYKTPTLKKKPALEMRGLQREVDTNNLNITTGAVSAVGGGIISQAFQDYNVKCQPPTAKQISNISGISCKDAYIMLYTEIVNDYEQCAQYYHRNGYLVNEYINNEDDIFGYVSKRYYFNILKMDIPNVHLHNVIEDDDTCDSIKDRLIDGVRLWNVYNTGVTLGDFSKDNVEYDFLS